MNSFDVVIQIIVGMFSGVFSNTGYTVIDEGTRKELKIYIPKRGIFRRDVEYVAGIVNGCLKDLCSHEMNDGRFDDWEIDYGYGNGDGTFVVRDSKDGDTEPVNNLVCSIGFGTF